MSQPSTWGVATVGPKTPTDMAQDMKGSLDALLSFHSGPSAPPYAVIGTKWADTATLNRIIYKIYDGADWVPFLTINTATNTARLASTNPITTLASDATETLASVESDSIEITGTTGITSFGTAGVGLMRFVRFADALLLTHSAALQLPAATNITTAAGDSLVAISLGSGDWRVLSYTPATIRVGLTPTRTVTSASSAGDRTFTAADAGRVVVLGGSANFTMSFNAAAVLGNGWTVDVKCLTSGIVILDPNGSESIDGLPSITVAKGQEFRIVCDASGLQTIGLNRRVPLYGRTATTAVSTIEVEVPPGYTRLFIAGYIKAAADSWIMCQLSNNNGGTWVSTGYLGAHAYGTSSGVVAGTSPPTNGLALTYGGATLQTDCIATLHLDDGASSIRLSSVSGYYSGVSAAANTTSIYNSTLAGTNLIRFLPTSVQFSAGTSFFVEGAR